jgi:3-methyladenine DNA glycosylase AlkD
VSDGTSGVDRLLEGVRSSLAAAADPVRAPQMQAYMKSAMPYRGAPMPVVRAIVHGLLAGDGLLAVDAWETAIRRLFDEASYREERYAALMIAGHRRYRGYQRPEALPLYRHLVETGAWWDIVDDVSHRVGDVLLVDRRGTSAVLRCWSREASLWLRRCSIIAQLGHKAETDVSLLGDVIDANVDDREFFIRKAIGWALREYARTDPEWVLDFVTSRADSLSPLSRREALKHLR